MSSKCTIPAWIDRGFPSLWSVLEVCPTLISCVQSSSTCWFVVVGWAEMSGVVASGPSAYPLHRSKIIHIVSESIHIIHFSNLNLKDAKLHTFCSTITADLLCFISTFTHVSSWGDHCRSDMGRVTTMWQGRAIGCLICPMITSMPA